MSDSNQAQDRIRKFLSEDPDPETDQDVRLGHLALERGYVTSEQVEECIREQKTLKESGETIRLGQLLLKRGFLSTARFMEILALQNKRLRVCLNCGRVYDISGKAEDASLRCLKCGEELQNPEEPQPKPPPADKRPSIGKYKLVREIGRGGMAVVYEAEDPELQRRVALKVLRMMDSDAQIIRRLHREAAIAAQLKHPNIVGIHEVGMVRDSSDQPTHFIAMDLIEGRPLSEIMAERETPMVTLLAWLEDVARAVAYAHSKGVIHRDLKPENVMIEQNSGRVILTDFGLAHAAHFETRLTRTNAVMGTPQYMAPEQVEGHTRDIDGRTDVYALGVMLYEMLVGRPPFIAGSPAELYQKILHDEPERPSRAVRNLDRDLEIICLKAMEKDRRRRYLDAALFADDVALFKKGSAIKARPPSLLYVVRKGLFRWRIALLSTAAFLMLGLGTLLLMRYFEFDRARTDAINAFQQENWEVAIATCERALHIKGDAELEGLLLEARAKLDKEKRLREEEMAGPQAYAKLKKEMEPIERLILDTRGFFYVKDVDIRAKLRLVEESLQTLEVLAHDKRYRVFPDVWALLGMGWYFAGDHRRAETFLLTAIELKSEDSWVFYYLGRINLQRSLLSLLAATDTRSDPDHESAKAFSDRALAYFEKSETGLQEMEKLVARAYRELAAGRKREASLLAEEGIRTYGNAIGTEDFWNVEGWVWGGVDKNRRINAYNLALKRRPHYAWVHFMMGVEYIMSGEPENALDSYDKCVAINPWFISGLVNRGVAHIRLGHAEAAKADYDAALKIDPTLAHVYANRARAKHMLKDRDGAMQDLGKALELDDNQPYAYLNRGVILQAEGDTAGALQDYEKVIEIAPKLPEGYVNRGSVLLDMDQPEDALEDFDKALEITAPNWVHRRFVERLRKRALDRIEDSGDGNPR